MYALQIHALRKLTCLHKEKPYFFIKFDRQITKILGCTEADEVRSICYLQPAVDLLRKNAEYRDPKSSKALSKLNNNLQEVSNIMRPWQCTSEVVRSNSRFCTMGVFLSQFQHAPITCSKYNDITSSSEIAVGKVRALQDIARP